MFLTALFVAVLAGEPGPCGPGEAWDTGMSMCMRSRAEGGPGASNAVSHDAMISPDGCPSGRYFHFGMSMCLPKPQGLGRKSIMVMGNGFFVGSIGSGPRFPNTLDGPDWVMANGGIDLASWNRLDLDVMLTAERWLYPASGYREILQIGERNAAGQPYVDAQHPHSSPIMGVAITDVISFSTAETRILRLSFAPRGETTDGPIAFMHRPTGTVNPDAPLGHHMGQDVGHVTSTVLSASLLIAETILEASAFNGREPAPTQVDLPIGPLNSYSARLVHHFAPWLTAAASFAYVSDPEADHSVPSLERYSASAYARGSLADGWRNHAALIWGGISHLDHTQFLNAIAVETVNRHGDDSIWGRAEILQRTAAELEIDASDEPRFVEAFTLGYTRTLTSLGPVDLSLGGMVTLSIAPPEFAGPYGGRAIGVGRAFLEARYMQMFVD